VLDIAVIKEPFRDRYAIFGIDIDDGQRYELRLSSEEVTNILDGDILVTSVDNIEVWMALLTKIMLNKVDSFAKVVRGGTTTPGGNESSSGYSSRAPSRPMGEKPSSVSNSASHVAAAPSSSSSSSLHRKIVEQPVQLQDSSASFVSYSMPELYLENNYNPINSASLNNHFHYNM
jgi:hypothetical protein